MDRYVVIMAGGSGTRFWPKSRVAHPKQFLSMGADRSLLRQTAERLTDMVPWDRILVVTGEAHANHARSHLSELPADNVLVEPTGRSTAPCVAWATEVIRARSPKARIAALPADHFIGDVPAFLRHLEVAFEAASERIVLFGIVPSHPETGFGYIERGPALAEAGGMTVYGVQRFVEKPSVDKALEYLRAGNFVWNSGMFVYSADVMAAELWRHLPELAKGVRRLLSSGDIDAVYPTLPAISIDCGVMERSEQIAVLPSNFGWSDVGSWDAAKEVISADPSANVTLGDARLVGAHGVMVDAQAGRLVAVVGVDDVIVVDTADAVLVLKRGASQDVKKVVETLRLEGRDDLL